MDLTVVDADRVKDFYQAVAGWTASSVDMGGYSDYCMNREDGQTVAGICHARGANVKLPAQWLIYIQVADLSASLRACRTGGGKRLSPIRKHGPARFAVIQDPAGAFAVLYQSGPAPKPKRKKATRVLRKSVVA